MTQVQKQRAESTQEEPEVPVEPVSVVNEKLAEDIDAILGEIDDVLEVNAEEFVRNYVQEGGQ